MAQSLGRNHLKFLGMAVVLAAAHSMAPATAYARTAVVNWTTYLRVGPGYQYGVLDQLDAQSTVDVQDCQKGWCRVTYPGGAAYVEESLFTVADIHARPTQTPPKGPCFDARVNGYLAHGEAIRVCGK